MARGAGVQPDVLMRLASLVPPGPVPVLAKGRDLFAQDQPPSDIELPTTREFIAVAEPRRCSRRVAQRLGELVDDLRAGLRCPASGSAPRKALARTWVRRCNVRPACVLASCAV